MTTPTNMVPDATFPFWVIRYATISSINLIPLGFVIYLGIETLNNMYNTIDIITGLRVSWSNIL